MCFLKFNFPSVKIAQAKTEWHIHNRNLTPCSVRSEFKLLLRIRYVKLTNQPKLLPETSKTLEGVSKVHTIFFIFIFYKWMRKCLASLITREMQIKAIGRYHYTSTEPLKLKISTTLYWQRSTGTLMHC